MLPIPLLLLCLTGLHFSNIKKKLPVKNQTHQLSRRKRILRARWKRVQQMKRSRQRLMNRCQALHKMILLPHALTKTPIFKVPIWSKKLFLIKPPAIPLVSSRQSSILILRTLWKKKQNQSIATKEGEEEIRRRMKGRKWKTRPGKTMNVHQQDSFQSFIWKTTHWRKSQSVRGWSRQGEEEDSASKVMEAMMTQKTMNVQKASGM